MVVPSIEAHCDNDTLLSARFWLVVESRGFVKGVGGGQPNMTKYDEGGVKNLDFSMT